MVRTTALRTTTITVLRKSRRCRSVILRRIAITRTAPRRTIPTGTTTAAPHTDMIMGTDMGMGMGMDTTTAVIITAAATKPVCAGR